MVETTRSAWQHNTEYHDMRFRVRHSNTATKVALIVPVIWNEELNTGAHVHETLGYITRKNDGRYMAVATHSLPLFADFNPTKISAQVVKASFEEAQMQLLSYVPTRVTMPKLLTMEDIPQYSRWHVKVTLNPLIQEKMKIKPENSEW